MTEQSNKRMFTCPQCEAGTLTLHEGYCEDCCNENQLQLDLHNAQYDRWQAMSDEQRWAEIKRAAYIGASDGAK